MPRFYKEITASGPRTRGHVCKTWAKSDPAEITGPLLRNRYTSRLFPWWQPGKGTGEQPRWLLLTHWHVSSPACLWKGQGSGIQRAFVPTTTTGAWEELSQHVFHKESLVLPRRDRGQIVGSCGWKDQTENKAPVCCRLHVWPRASHPEPQFQPLLKGRWDLEGFFFKDRSF